MMKDRSHRVTDCIGIICILIGAGVLIRSACFVVSGDIWFDELFTVELAGRPLPQLIGLSAGDVHPPLYYILVRLVYIILNPLFGTDVTAAAKITSLIPYIGVFVYLVTFIRRRFGLLSAGIAFLLILTMPHMSEYMVEARMYSWCAFCLLAMYIHASEYLRTAHTRLLHPVCMLIYGIAAMYLHYYGVIGAGLIAIGLLFVIVLPTPGHGHGTDSQRKSVKGPVMIICICMILALAAYIPWIRILLSQIGQVSQSYWILPVSFRTIPGCVKYIFIPSFESGALNIVCAGVMTAAYAGLLVRYIAVSGRGKAYSPQNGTEAGSVSEYQTGRCFVIGSAVIPAALILAGLAASLLIRPVFVYRYMFPVMFIFWTGFAVTLSDAVGGFAVTASDATETVPPPVETPVSGQKRPVITPAGAVSAVLLAVIFIVYALSGIRTFNLFRWGEKSKTAGMNECVSVFERIEDEYPDTLIVCNFNQIQALMWHYLDNDSVLWGYTDETLIADICGRAPIVMTDDADEIRRLVSGRGQSGFLFFGSGNARDEIIDEWKSYNFFTELLQDSCFLERYYFNIYKVSF